MKDTLLIDHTRKQLKHQELELKSEKLRQRLANMATVAVVITLVVTVLMAFFDR